MLADDGDVARGLGLVSMYSAWVEEDVDDVLRALNEVEPFTEKIQRWQIGRKLEHAATLVERLASPELADLPAGLRAGIELFEERNQVIHGRIYAGFDRKDYVQSGRPNVPKREITLTELYDLANEFMQYRGALIGPQLFRIPRAIASARKNAP